MEVFFSCGPAGVGVGELAAELEERDGWGWGGGVFVVDYDAGGHMEEGGNFLAVNEEVGFGEIVFLEGGMLFSTGEDAAGHDEG